MNTEEKLREMLISHHRSKNGAAAAGGNHLRDADFSRLIESSPQAEKLPVSARELISGSGGSIAPQISAIREHLLGCASCLAKFTDFYDFFVMPADGETLPPDGVYDDAWQKVSARIAEKEQKPNFWAWLFPAGRKPIFFPALGWGLAALLLIFTGVSLFVAWQSQSEQAQLAAALANQKQSFEEQLKALEKPASAVESDTAAEKARLADEKAALQKQIARLENELEQAKQPPRQTAEKPSPQNLSGVAQPKADNSLIAVNTPIYDVFPSDLSVRGSKEPAKNKLSIPVAAKSVVLILNANAIADFPDYQAALVSDAGKIIWRGTGFKKGKLDSFTLTFSRAALKPGSYRLILSGKNAAGAAQTVAEYSITVSDAR